MLTRTRRPKSEISPVRCRPSLAPFHNEPPTDFAPQGGESPGRCKRLLDNVRDRTGQTLSALDRWRGCRYRARGY